MPWSPRTPIAHGGQRPPLRVGRLRHLAEPVAGNDLSGQRPVAAHRLDGRVDDRRVGVVEELARRLLRVFPTW